ncbi:E3 ubiquitin ligase BIG BROTHER-related-like [Dioscorea cayenensis subsp. rotundata]|uniref:E3 ubiquitin ligase BIG BROTHER-related-like n=1 Tax=Dioscorea cayennensis subsp. rotundata TaxID=55577 RepID=A0AB40CCL7_DIOCR|nr:E3 ubiquitin ligase BIG BROTHER-related-like [Dioscorea cayenensis subsp. rotundata]
MGSHCLTVQVELVAHLSLAEILVAHLSLAEILLTVRRMVPPALVVLLSSTSRTFPPDYIKMEAAYLMLMSGRGISGDYASSAGSYEDDGEFDVHDHEEGSEYEEEYEEDEFVEDGHLVDPTGFDSNEAYARALQDAEEREIAAQLMAFAGLNDCEDAF